jgi:sugar lactone lactonase YvrE
MRSALIATGLFVAILLSYLLLWPVPVDPVAWKAPQDRGLVDPFGADDRLRAAHAIDLGEHSGPEDVTAGIDGRLYATTKDGFVVQIDGSGHVAVFAAVGGRPLGIETDGDGSLLVANAYLGLQRVYRDGSVRVLLDEIDGQPLDYANDVAVAGDGTIFLSESSTKFAARRYGGTYESSLLDILEHGGHGRIIEFDPATNAARVLIEGLNYANGIAISQDQAYLMIAETGSYRILRHWLSGTAAGTTDTVVDNLPGFPDNINNGRNGRFWVGLVAPRSAVLDRLSGRPLLRKIVQRLPAVLRPQAKPSSHVIGITGDGEVLMNLQDPSARYPSLTGVCETADALYLTRLAGNELPVLRKEDLF